MKGKCPTLHYIYDRANDFLKTISTFAALSVWATKTAKDSRKVLSAVC